MNLLIEAPTHPANERPVMLATWLPALFAQQQGEPSFILPLLMVAIFAMFYLLILRPGQRRQEQERLRLLSSLKKNDEVLTASGIYGTVAAVSEKEDEVTIKVADNVRIRMTKGSIVRNLTNEGAAKEQKTETGITTK
jgi:preprotein translocase subunit YajC